MKVLIKDERPLLPNCNGSLLPNCNGCILEGRGEGWYPVTYKYKCHRSHEEVCFTGMLRGPKGVTFTPCEQSFSVKEWLE